jgi:hypothetical protein
MRFRLLLILAAVVAIQAGSFAQQNTFFSRPPSPRTAEVGFGIFPVGPIDDSPLCLVQGAGGPTDPCSYKIHKLVPEETTIRWGGEVTFHVHGGGHGIAIYNVSRKTTRLDIGELLCQNSTTDPGTIEDPAAHPCQAAPLPPPNPSPSPGGANAARDITIRDASGDVVIVTGTAPPNNRIAYAPGRLFSAGGNQFLLGISPGPPPAPQIGPTNGQLLTYRFLVPGRFLVICMNRSHFMNDWMFGFVNVELF